MVHNKYQIVKVNQEEDRNIIGAYRQSLGVNVERYYLRSSLATYLKNGWKLKEIFTIEVI